MTMHKLAVYGTLKKDYGNHRVLGEKPTYLGEGMTKDNFTMGGWGVPIVYKHPLAPIAVELYEINEDQLFGPVDRLESNGYYYNREETTILLDGGEEHDAWLYFATAG